jgi:hypothetical protein
VFPSLLKKLLEKDFGDAIRSGFACTGIFPFNADRVLAKLPQDQRQVDSDVQQQLLNKLSSIRYSPGPSTKAPRPKKKDKLPAGSSYTCTPEGGEVNAPDDEAELDSPQAVLHAPKRARRLQPAGDARPREESSSNQDSSSEDSSGDEEQSSSNSEEVSSSEELSVGIHAIVDRRKKKMEESQNKKMEERQNKNEQVKNSVKSAENDEQEYLPGSYVVVVYDGQWYVAQVLDKELEPEAESDESYLFLNFMKKSLTSDSLQWPTQTDKLNMLREDILFSCMPPSPSAGTSSSRNTTFSLSREDLLKAKLMHMMRKKVNYLTKNWFFLLVPYWYVL